MKTLEMGQCPKCQCSLLMHKTSTYKRYIKCDGCGISYPMPKKGKVNNSALECPKTGFPVFYIERDSQKAYFWADQPCFSCIQFDKCSVIKDLISEFKELSVYGY